MTDMWFGKTVMADIRALKATFGVATEPEVIAKALELAKIMAKEADDDRIVNISSKDGQPIRLHLADR